MKKEIVMVYGNGIMKIVNYLKLVNMKMEKEKVNGNNIT